MTWIEGLNLNQVVAGEFLLVALPMPLLNAEAAPVRALVRPIDDWPAYLTRSRREDRC